MKGGFVFLIVVLSLCMTGNAVACPIASRGLPGVCHIPSDPLAEHGFFAPGSLSPGGRLADGARSASAAVFDQIAALCRNETGTFFGHDRILRLDPGLGFITTPFMLAAGPGPAVRRSPARGRCSAGAMLLIGFALIASGIGLKRKLPRPALRPPQLRPVRQEYSMPTGNRVRQPLYIIPIPPCSEQAVPNRNRMLARAEARRREESRLRAASAG